MNINNNVKLNDIILNMMNINKSIELLNIIIKIRILIIPFNNKLWTSIIIELYHIIIKYKY